MSVVSHVVLRRIVDEDGSRLLEASITAAGDVLIEGYDLGDGVERLLGVREYEWAWTISVDDIPALLRALGTGDNVLSALEDRFSGDNAVLLSSFIEANEIPTTRWSRYGDD